MESGRLGNRRWTRGVLTAGLEMTDCEESATHDGRHAPGLMEVIEPGTTTAAALPADEEQELVQSKQRVAG